MDDGGIQQRKIDHLRIVAEEDVAHGGGTLLDCVQLVHCAMPELALDEIDTGSEFFGKPLRAPLMITSMTGGGGKSGELNHLLAAAAGRTGIAFAVGSQRVLLEHPERREDFAVRAELGEGVLLGNIGAQQLTQYPPQRIVELLQMIDADGVCVHLNPAHELAQADGDRDFRGQLEALQALLAELGGRVLVKETGCGISPAVARQLSQAGVKYIDVAGAGGTSWTKVEQHRASEQLSASVAGTFGDWGIPTAAAILGARQVLSDDKRIIASGGMADGVDAAKALVLGADIVGFARAVLNAMAGSAQDTPERFITRIIHELKVAMLLTGCRDLAKLKRIKPIFTGELVAWMAGLARLELEQM